MDEVLVFRHVPCEGPGYLGQFFAARGIPYRIVAIDQGAPTPRSIDRVAGLVFMGGPMSVNEELGWIEDSLTLIRAAHARGLPVLGHCLGGQLIAKALGARVRTSPVKEIGWWPITRASRTPDWAQPLPGAFEAFHWHGETFDLPDDATLLFSSAACANQGFVSGRSLALQFHVEMMTDMVSEWAALYADEIAVPTDSVQDKEQMHNDLERRIAASQRIADLLYGQWISWLS